VEVQSPKIKHNHDLELNATHSPKNQIQAQEKLQASNVYNQALLPRSFEDEEFTSMPSTSTI